MSTTSNPVREKRNARFGGLLLIFGGILALVAQFFPGIGQAALDHGIAVLAAGAHEQDELTVPSLQ